MINVDGEEYSIPAEFWQADYIYHYTSIQSAIEHILYHGNLRLGPFSKTSDPFEYNGIQIGVGIGITTIDEDNYKRKIGYSVAKRLTDEFESYRFISFCGSENEQGNIDKLGFLKQRMWSQYAINHSGACLVFSKKRIEELLICKGLQPYSERVKYIGFDNAIWTYPAIDVPDGFDQDEEDLYESHQKQYLREYFFTKHLDFKDEVEHRIIISYPKEKYLYFEFKDSLRAIVVSDKIEEFHNEQAIKFADKLKVPLLSLRWNFRSPSIFRFWEKMI